MGLRDHLEEAFGKADADHYAWQTEGHYVSGRERELVEAAFSPLGVRVLDLGCGEGATLAHLGAPEGAVGVDLFEDKLAFARQRLPRCTFVAASAESLPFEDGHFDHVIVRDLIHHLEDPDPVIAEIARVLSPRGRVDVLEPCRYNPLVFAHAIAIRAERGELRSTARFLETCLSEHLQVEFTQRLQPLALHRVLLHPSFGLPQHATRLAPLIRTVEWAAGFVVPRFAWTYIHVRARKAP